MPGKLVFITSSLMGSFMLQIEKWGKRKPLLFHMTVATHGPKMTLITAPWLALKAASCFGIDAGSCRIKHPGRKERRQLYDTIRVCCSWQPEAKQAGLNPKRKANHWLIRMQWGGWSEKRGCWQSPAQTVCFSSIKQRWAVSSGWGW